MKLHGAFSEDKVVSAVSLVTKARSKESEPRAGRGGRM
jgi:hypothetical protein